MSERLTRELEAAQREVRKALARVRGVEVDEEGLVERQFSGLTDEERARHEAEKREVADLERRHQESATPPKKKRSLALRMYGWRKRHGG
jgi:hypothetical protein